MGETNASRLRRETPTLREAAPRLRVAPLALCRGSRSVSAGFTLSAVTPLGETPSGVTASPPQWLTVRNLGSPRPQCPQNLKSTIE